MSILYIANCKAQPEVFTYRVPESRQLIQETIPAGGQKMIYRETDKATLELIAQQHAKYGLIPVADIDRARRFVSLCYQFDKPISRNQITYTLENNTTVLTDLGKERRDASAVAITASLEQAADDSPRRMRMKNASLEIQEEKLPGDNSEGLNEIISVDPRGNKPGAKRTKGRN